ncbi:MAG: DUF4860 domain-containing protein [Clostridiales bacterium]|nr:DUF4860 domain-containing protein [Clostridiales bacterium]
MGFKMKQNHMIDFLFPVALLFVFALSALTVALFATKIYESTVEDSSRNNTARTALSYVTEKIHQNDADGRITTGEFDGCDALIMTEYIDGRECTTYIYVAGKELKELFVASGFVGDASDGTVILDVEQFTMKQVNSNLLEFTCTDDEGKRASATVGMHSDN